MKIVLSAFAAAIMACCCMLAISCNDSDEQPPAPANPEPNNTLKVLSWSVRMNDIDGKDRMPSLLKIIGSANADIIALQGVWPQLLDAMTKESWAAGYQKFKKDEQAVSTLQNGLVIWAKFPMKLMVRFDPDSTPENPYPLALAAKMTVNSRQLTIVNVKLEPRLDQVAKRKKQLQSLYTLFEGSNDVLLVGDFGFDGDQPEQSAVHKNLTDVWALLKPGEKGCTWDMEANGLARKYAYFGETSRRIDRIFEWSNYWTPMEIQLVGTEPTTPGDASMFPSDHFGLLVTFAKNPHPAAEPSNQQMPAAATAVESQPLPQPGSGM